MKKVLLFLICFGLNQSLGHAQCGDQTYPFYFNWDPFAGGPNGSAQVIFSKDPSGTTYDPGFQLNKYYHDPAHPSAPIVINYYSPNVDDKFYQKDCVDQNTLDACINEAFNDWASLCPAQFNIINSGHVNYNSFDQHGLEIEWGPNSGSFQNSADAGGTTIGVFTSDPTYSWIIHTGDDEAPVILLRDDKSFKDAGKQLGTCPQVCRPDGVNYYYDVCAILLHEIGHTFGLMDLKTVGSPDFMKNAVMWGDAFPGCDKSRNQLTCYDKCYFTRLYCPSEAPCNLQGGVINNRRPPAFSLYPNPASNVLSIDYDSKELPAILSVSTILGDAVYRHQLLPHQGSESIGTEHLPPGAYVVRLETSQGFQEHLLIIQK